MADLQLNPWVESVALRESMRNWHGFSVATVLHIPLIPCWIAEYALRVPAQDHGLRNSGFGGWGCDARLCAGAVDAPRAAGPASLDDGEWPAAKHRTCPAAIARRFPMGRNRAGIGPIRRCELSHSGSRYDRIFSGCRDSLPVDAGGESGLWIGTGDGLVRWKNGSATLLTTHQGLPDNSIRGIAQTSDGTLWVWTESGLARRIDQQFQTVASENGLPGSGITSIAADAAGGLWVGTMRGTAVFRGGHWQPGPGTNERVDGRPGLVKTTASGEVLIASTNGVFLDHAGTLTAAVGKTALPLDEISFLDQLSDGTVAVASKSSMVLAPRGASTSHGAGTFVVSKELPGSRIESIYADREQSLWVGTNRGLGPCSHGRGWPGGPAFSTL